MSTMLDEAAGLGNRPRPASDRWFATCFLRDAGSVRAVLVCCALLGFSCVEEEQEGVHIFVKRSDLKRVSVPVVADLGPGPDEQEVKRAKQAEKKLAQRSAHELPALETRAREDARREVRPTRNLTLLAELARATLAKRCGKVFDADTWPVLRRKNLWVWAPDEHRRWGKVPNRDGVVRMDDRGEVVDVYCSMAAIPRLSGPSNELLRGVMAR